MLPIAMRGGWSGHWLDFMTARVVQVWYDVVLNVAPGRGICVRTGGWGSPRGDHAYVECFALHLSCAAPGKQV